MENAINTILNVKANKKVNALFVRAIGRAKERFLAEGNIKAIGELDNYVVYIENEYKKLGYVGCSLAAIYDLCDVLFEDSEDKHYLEMINAIDDQINHAA